MGAASEAERSRAVAQARLPTRMGGLGLTSQAAIAPAACVGSWALVWRRMRDLCPQLFGDVDGGSRILWLPMTEATKEADCRAYLVTHAEGLIANLRDGFTVVVSCQEGLHRSVEFTRQLLTLCAIPHLARAGIKQA